MYNDEWFCQLRRICNVPEDFLNESWNPNELVSGGGKGGCPMAFIGSSYIVKELSDADHQALLGIAKSYYEHVSQGDSLLATILCHFKVKETGRRFFAMRNVLGEGPFLAKYDLKGCNDDKTLELFGERLDDACGTGKVAAFNIDLVVTQEQRTEVLRKMANDTEWLVRNRLMDYSLIVGVKTGPAGFVSSDEEAIGRTPMVQTCRDGSQVAVCVGIVDFLQRWTLCKKAARVIKCLETNKATVPPAQYAHRFCCHFEERFVAASKSMSPSQA